jgi:hypothetical protein
MRLLMTMLAASLLAACATTAKYEANLQREVGRPIDEVVMRWGQPVSVTEVNGKKLYQFRSAGTPIYNSSYNPYLGVQTTVSQFYCNTQLLVNVGVVEQWSYQGNNCVAD